MPESHVISLLLNINISLQGSKAEIDRCFASLTKQRKDVHKLIDKMQQQETEITYLQSQERKKRAHEVRMINEQIARDQKEKDKREEQEAVNRSINIHDRVNNFLEHKPELQAILEYLEDVNCTLQT